MSPDVSVRITEAGGAQYEYLMDKAGGAYQLRVGRLPGGDYRYRANTSFGGQAYVAEGSFSIQQVDLETAVTTADWDLPSSRQRSARRSDGSRRSTRRFWPMNSWPVQPPSLCCTSGCARVRSLIGRGSWPSFLRC